MSDYKVIVQEQSGTIVVVDHGGEMSAQQAAESAIAAHNSEVAAKNSEVAAELAKQAAESLALQDYTGTMQVKDVITEVDLRHFGAVDGQDASDALDAFAAYVLANPNKAYVISGNYLTSRPWMFYHPNVSTIHWNLTLTTTAPMIFALALEGTNVQHTGKITVKGQGTPGDWNSFTLEYGVVVSGCQSSSLPSISCFHCKYFGVTFNEDGSLGIPLRSGQTYKNNTMMSFNAIYARDCGGYNTGSAADGSGTLDNLGFVAQYTSPVNTGSGGLTSQYTTVTVDMMPAEKSIDSGLYAVIDNKMFRVTARDNVNKTLKLYPWIPSTSQAGTIKYVFGGAINCRGSNGGPTKIGKIDAMRCGFGLLDGALYGSVIIDLVAQLCGVGIVIGGEATSISPLNSITIGAYTESVYRNLVFIGSGSGAVYYRNGNFSGTPYTNCEKIYPQDASGTSQYYNIDTFARIMMPSRTADTMLGLFAKSRAYNNIDSAITIDPGKAIPLTYNRNSWTINLADPTATNLSSGLDSYKLTMIGTGVNGTPTGTFTFNPPSGWTVNGLTSDAIANFYGPSTFEFFWNMSTKNISVFCSSTRGATAAPTTGTWTKGAIVYNASPTEAGTAGSKYIITGWICTTAGTPGTWLPMRTLTGN